MTEEERLLKFFLWFRQNGEKYICHPIEHMIKIYLDEKNKENESM